MEVLHDEAIIRYLDTFFVHSNYIYFVKKYSNYTRGLLANRLFDSNAHQWVLMQEVILHEWLIQMFPVQQLLKVCTYYEVLPPEC